MRVGLNQGGRISAVANNDYELRGVGYGSGGKLCASPPYALYVGNVIN